MYGLHARSMRMAPAAEETESTRVVSNTSLNECADRKMDQTRPDTRLNSFSSPSLLFLLLIIHISLLVRVGRIYSYSYYYTCFRFVECTRYCLLGLERKKERKGRRSSSGDEEWWSKERGRFGLEVGVVWLEIFGRSVQGNSIANSNDLIFLLLLKRCLI